MTENQFIFELELALKQLPAEERKDIILDIREYFTDGREDGKSEIEIADSLGSPEKIAKELIASYPFIKNEVELDSSNKIITIQDDTYMHIDIAVQHGSLFVFPSDSTKTTIELVGPNDKLQLSGEVIGDKLFVKLTNLRHWLFMFNMKAITLNVFIPKKLYQSISLKTNNGRITSEKLLSQKVNVRSNNGRIQLKEIASSALIVETDNGRIEVDRVQADIIRMKTDNGRIEMRHIDAESVSAESDNGRIMFEHVEGKIVGVTDNGRISLQTESIDQNIDFRTDNGSIMIQSSHEPTNVSIHAKTSHGKIDVFGERNSRTVMGLGENTIRLKSGNGKITVG